MYVDELLSRHPWLSGYILKEFTRLVDGSWKIKANLGHFIDVESFAMPSVEENNVAHTYHYANMLT